MSLADEIRDRVFRTILEPAFQRGEPEVTVRSGDVHRDMGLVQRMPAVCAALEARKFQTGFGVFIKGRQGPTRGANVLYVFRPVGAHPPGGRPGADPPPRQTRGKLPGARAGRRAGQVNESAKRSGAGRTRPDAPSVIGPGDTIYLVSCVKTKHNAKVMARDLYASAWFRKARAYVEATGGSWFILSALHGLVPPDRLLRPYEKTLRTMPAAERRRWARKVDAQLRELAPNARHVTFLAGRIYREFLAAHLRDRGISMDVPMEGLKIGEQLAWLCQAVETCRRA